ncbi:unnamed protein product [Meloidogyne enterolobii]|uniref:Uncharacterized protein n=1 Tax=Meloidogyne enterolobii TaxID=390850 RepID=A0ACB1B858_MELEN
MKSNPVFWNTREGVTRVSGRDGICVSGYGFSFRQFSKHSFNVFLTSCLPLGM